MASQKPQASSTPPRTRARLHQTTAPQMLQVPGLSYAKPNTPPSPLAAVHTDSSRLSTLATLSTKSTSASGLPPLNNPNGPQNRPRRTLFEFLGNGLPSNYPNVRIVFRLVCVFIAFVAVLSIAARLPTKAAWFLIMIVGTMCSLGLAIDYSWSYASRCRKVGFNYRPNLGNTIAVVLLTIPMFTVLYLRLWYPHLRKDVLATTTDVVDKVGFPSVALFQRKDWSSQANLRSRHGGPSGSKCYLGWYNDSAPACSTLPPETFGNSTECTCKELWSNNDQVIEDFEWMNTSYRYIAFDSPSWLLSNTPTYMLLLQSFFDYNVTKAIADSSTYNPSLSLAIYDPALGMLRSFDQGYTRMRLINANGIVAVNVGLRIRQAPGQAPAYDYPLDIALSPATDLVCDTSTNLTYQYACHVSLFITIPNFERTIITRQKLMSWSDVLASAGAYFSFVQFLSWIISAQAFQG